MTPLDANRLPAPLAERWQNDRRKAPGPRLFTRMGLDIPVHEAIPLALDAACRSTGLLIYGARPVLQTTDASAGVLDGATRNVIVPTFIDEPLDPRSMEGAAEIEFQLIPAPRMRTGSGAFRGDWVPTLPSDGTHTDALRDRVELARQVSGHREVRVGAAIAAANLPADLPWLADCGFDYVCILADAQYGLSSHEQIQLGETESSLRWAIEAQRSRAPKQLGLRLSSASVTPARAALWHAMGIEAVGIDHWLRSRAPSPEPKFQASFGGILIESSRTGGSAEWLLEGVQQFQQALDSERHYLGW